MTAGALQGCPLSGCVYAVATAPFASEIGAVVDGRLLATTRICADDIGAAVGNVASLTLYHRCCSTMEASAGLEVKPEKCNLVCLWVYV